jgi:hypothetical protein
VEVLGLVGWGFVLSPRTTHSIPIGVWMAQLLVVGLKFKN